MQVERQYVDSHGQSEVAFAFCHLLGFALLPRLKGLARQKLYLPNADSRDSLGTKAPGTFRRDGYVRMVARAHCRGGVWAALLASSRFALGENPVYPGRYGEVYVLRLRRLG
jgi:hypothetical protein